MTRYQKCRLAGAQNLSCLITCSDTMKATLYFDYKELGRTTWTAGYTDSIIAEKDTIIEIPIRTSTLNRLPIFSGKYRLRVSQHSTATPSDYDSSSTYTQKWIWKP
ncbi:MAG: hypothetical protein H3C35_03690 [Bacteroidetes bacterium]|nr:hypothetical protein [Bacteroidota bacterium]